MFRTVLKSRVPSTFRRLSWSLLSASLCALLLALLTSSLPAYAQGQPGGNVSDPGVRAVDIARPAVVRIYTSLPSHLTVHFTTSDITFPQDSTKAYTLSLSGSGTFISSNGDILTADHVVNPPKDSSLDASLHQQAASDVSSYINQNAKALGLSQMTPAQVEQALDSAQMRSASSYDSPQSEVYLSTDYTGPLTATTMDQVPSTIHATVDKIEAQSAADAKDVAIIHAAFTDTPSVNLGDSSSVQTQDALKIIGFPGNGDINDIPSNLLTPSITDINVSSIKTTTSGAPVIQVSGTVGPGDSGGPALDTSGNVVGIVSFGPVTANGSTTGTSFLQASNSANDLLKPLNLNTAAGTFQTLWSQAFASYAATTPGHWHTAQQQFQQLSTQYPNFKAVQSYLDYTNTQAQSETTLQPTTTAKSTISHTPVPATASSSSLRATVMTVGAIVLLALLVLVLVVMNIRGRRKARVKSATSDQQQPGVTTPPATQGQPVAPSPSNTAILRPWPCGHMNRSSARFCSICGEPAPPPTVTIYPMKP
jgi:serine protease Do